LDVVSTRVWDNRPHVIDVDFPTTPKMEPKLVRKLGGTSWLDR